MAEAGNTLSIAFSHFSVYSLSLPTHSIDSGSLELKEFMLSEFQSTVIDSKSLQWTALLSNREKSISLYCTREKDMIFYWKRNLLKKPWTTVILQSEQRLWKQESIRTSLILLKLFFTTMWMQNLVQQNTQRFLTKVYEWASRATTVTSVLHSIVHSKNILQHFTLTAFVLVTWNYCFLWMTVNFLMLMWTMKTRCFWTLLLKVAVGVHLSMHVHISSLLPHLHYWIATN